MNENEEILSSINPAQRVLLLPHCLRRAETCQGKYSKQGMECQECNPECPIYQLRRVAVQLGYMGVCIAPGGRLALNYVKEKKPLAIVAVACDKELEEGMRGVNELASESRQEIPIVVIPLSKDGCLDTEVDIRVALEKIALGCALPAVG